MSSGQFGIREIKEGRVAHCCRRAGFGEQGSSGVYRIGWTDEVAGWYSCLHGEERQDRVLDGGGKGDTEQSSLSSETCHTH